VLSTEGLLAALALLRARCERIARHAKKRFLLDPENCLRRTSARHRQNRWLEQYLHDEEFHTALPSRGTDNSLYRAEKSASDFPIAGRGGVAHRGLGLPPDIGAPGHAS